jgi:hypothetical protein
LWAGQEYPAISMIFLVKSSKMQNLQGPNIEKVLLMIKAKILIFGSKTVFYAHCAVGRKVFFYPKYCGIFFSLIKELLNVPFYIRKNNYSPKIESKKNEIWGLFW